MHHGRRRQRDLRRRARDRHQEFEVVDEDASTLRPRQLARHLHGRRAVQPVAFGGMKFHRQLRRHHLHILEFQHEIPMPGVAVVLAVGDDLEPEIFLHAHDVADRGLLNRPELGVRDLLLLRLFACVDESVRPDQAADMVGAKGRLGAFHYSRSIVTVLVVMSGQSPTHACRPDDSIRHAMSRAALM